MRKPIPPDEWLSENDGQILWAIHHLSDKWGMVPYPQDRSAVLKVLEDIWRSDYGVDKFARIKRAWNGHCFRQKNDKKTFSYVLSVDVAGRLKRQARTFKMPQSRYLTSLIQGDGAHLARLKEEYAKKAIRSKHRSASDKEESRLLSRLRFENEHKSALIDRYEEVIKQLVREKLLSDELHSRGLGDKAELDDEKKLALWTKAEEQASEHLESAHQQAMNPTDQALIDSPQRP